MCDDEAKFGGLRRYARRRSRGRTPHRPRRLSIEALEARHLLAANFVINEFMADNGGQLLDNYGAASDWVEIHNSGDMAGSLNGYYLTDEAGDKTKWQFPDVTIPAGGYLLVFASNQDDRDPAQPLHTNFALSNNGEYLGLIAPDGQTVVHEYAPPVPPQHENVSYGVGEVASEFNYLSPGAAAKTIVPTNNAYDAVWSSPSYVPDSNWIDGTTGIGFGQTYNGFIVRTYDANIQASSPIGTSLDSIEEALEVIGNPAARASVTGRKLCDREFRQYRLATQHGPLRRRRRVSRSNQSDELQSFCHGDVCRGEHSHRRRLDVRHSQQRGLPAHGGRL